MFEGCFSDRASVIQSLGPSHLPGFPTIALNTQEPARNEKGYHLLKRNSFRHSYMFRSNPFRLPVMQVKHLLPLTKRRRVIHKEARKKPYLKKFEWKSGGAPSGALPPRGLWYVHIFSYEHLWMLRQKKGGVNAPFIIKAANIPSSKNLAI